MGRGKTECGTVDVQAKRKTLEVFLVHPPVLLGKQGNPGACPSQGDAAVKSYAGKTCRGLYKKDFEGFFLFA